MKRVFRQAIILLVLVVLGGTSVIAYSADQETIRIRIGLKLFRAILAADTHIDAKQNTDARLTLAVIYKNNKQQADVYTDMLQNLGKGQKQGKIKGIPITVQAISTDHLEQLASTPFAGIYIVEELDNSSLQQLVNYAIEHHIISYSPFAGAVEQGISAGLSIGARVKPYINLQTLRRSELQLKPFFLKVSKHYEP